MDKRRFIIGCIYTCCVIDRCCWQSQKKERQVYALLLQTLFGRRGGFPRLVIDRPHCESLSYCLGVLDSSFYPLMTFCVRLSFPYATHPSIRSGLCIKLYSFVYIHFFCLSQKNFVYSLKSHEQIQVIHLEASWLDKTKREVNMSELLKIPLRTCYPKTDQSSTHHTIPSPNLCSYYNSTAATRTSLSSRGTLFEDFYNTSLLLMLWWVQNKDRQWHLLDYLQQPFRVIDVKSAPRFPCQCPTCSWVLGEHLPGLYRRILAIG